jgi:hypothetical protein
VQHLGYLEFGELRRVAQRTIDQRRVFVNNLALRHAIEELKQVNDYDRLYPVLVSAFYENDFDSFELRLLSPLAQLPEMKRGVVIRSRDGSCIRWTKPGSPQRTRDGWGMSLDLVSSDGRDRASMLVYRHYNQHALQLDVNLLTSEFPGALADALGRARLGTKRPSGNALPSEADAATRAISEAS